LLWGPTSLKPSKSKLLCYSIKPFKACLYISCFSSKTSTTLRNPSKLSSSKHACTFHVPVRKLPLLYETLQNCLPQIMPVHFMFQFQTFHYLTWLINCPRLLIHPQPSDTHQQCNFSGQTIKKISGVFFQSPTRLYDVPKKLVLIQYITFTVFSYNREMPAFWPAWYELSKSNPVQCNYLLQLLKFRSYTKLCCWYRLKGEAGENWEWSKAKRSELKISGEMCVLSLMYSYVVCMWVALCYIVITRFVFLLFVLCLFSRFVCFASNFVFSVFLCRFVYCFSSFI
jgi:hypothetical protein